MSKKAIILLVCILCNLISFSQINNYLENVVLIQSHDKTRSGSGFIYNTGQKIYLLTAKHVLLNDSGGLISDEIYFYSYPKNASKENSIEYMVNLRKAFDEKKARYGNTFDIIAIQIGLVQQRFIRYFTFINKENKPSLINDFSLNDCVLKLDSIYAGEEVFMIGYPKSLEILQHSNFNFNRPLLRSGVVSGKDYEYNTILIDCPSHGGNSGGPVLLKKNNKIKMIGLVSSYVPYIDYWINPVTKITNRETSNSGLTVVVPFYQIIRDLYKEELWR